MITEDAYGGILAIPTRTTNDLVYERLKEAIVTGALPPGHRIIEERIVARLGVSRAPLREAMRLLAHEGLIQRTPRRGAYVAVLFREDAVELYEFRMALKVGPWSSAVNGSRLPTSKTYVVWCRSCTLQARMRPWIS